MFLSFRRSERRRGRRAELLRLNKEVEMRMRGEEVEEEKRKWKGIEVTSVLKMFKQQKPQKRVHQPIHHDLNKNIPRKPNPNENQTNTILTGGAPTKVLCHPNLKTRCPVMSQFILPHAPQQKIWPKVVAKPHIKTSPCNILPGGETRYLLPSSIDSTRGLLMRQQGEAKLKLEERQLRRFEGRVRVLSTSYSHHRLRRTSRLNTTSSTCSFSSTKRRRRRRGRSFAEGGGLERRMSQQCAPPPPVVSPLRPTYTYKTLYPGMI